MKTVGLSPLTNFELYLSRRIICVYTDYAPLRSILGSNKTIVISHIYRRDEIFIRKVERFEKRQWCTLHISSLPSPYGIGTIGRSAYEFIDFLVNAGQKYWQVLPVSPTGYGDSPYQSYSTFAGNPYFVDFEKLSESGNLKPEVYQR